MDCQAACFSLRYFLKKELLQKDIRLEEFKNSKLLICKITEEILTSYKNKQRPFCKSKTRSVYDLFFLIYKVLCERLLNVYSIDHIWLYKKIIIEELSQ